MPKKTNIDYSFFDKEKLKTRSRSLDPKVERMYEAFFEFRDLQKALSEEAFLNFSYLSDRCGLTERLLKKLEKAVEAYRNMYLELMIDIFQKRIQDYTGN